MAHKRKFSESFRDDTDVVQNLLKYRAASSTRQTKAEPKTTVTQDHLRRIVDQFVAVYEGLDDGNPSQKPNFSYTELIFLAIMRSPNFCLPISEIYRYVHTQYAFFHNSTKEHWKNAIRHSLSKTKCFTKIGLDNQKPRNGILNRSAFLWTVMPKSLLNFARGDYRPTTKVAGDNALRASFQQVNALGLWEGCVSTLTSRIEAFRSILNTSQCPAKIFQLQVCNFTDTAQFPVANLCTAGATPLPFPSPLMSREAMNGVHYSVPSPCNSGAINLSRMPCEKTVSNPSSPNSEDGSDSFYSTSPSDSSGYDTIGELSSPEHGSSVDQHRATLPFDFDVDLHDLFRSELLTDSIPEVTPSCLMNIPAIPEFPSFEEARNGQTHRMMSLACVVDSSVDVSMSPCLYQSCLTSDIISASTISMEDRSILLEFLSF